MRKNDDDTTLHATLDLDDMLDPDATLDADLQAGLLICGDGLRSGGVIAVRIFFQVQGQGSFRANQFDTAKGMTTAWVRPGLPLRLSAQPAPGARFSHWTLNGNFASSSPQTRVSARRGLAIRAVFEPLAE